MTDTGLPPKATGGLRPAEAGVVLDRGPRSAHIVATVIDLAQRGWLEIEALEASGGADWAFSRARTPAQWWLGRRRLARYERLLLRGIFGRRSQVRFTQIVSVNIHRVFRCLTRDALVRGWLLPTESYGMLAPDAEELRGELRAVRVALVGLRPPPGVNESVFYSRWLPYAVAFGLMPGWAQQLDVLKAATPGSGSATSHSGTDILVGWWSGTFSERMTGAVGSWSHHSSGSGHGATVHHHGGHDHGGFDSGHHGGGHGGSW